MLPPPAAPRPPLLWPLGAEPPAPPWLCVAPGAAGLALGLALPPPPALLLPPPPPLLPPPAPGWPLPREPLPREPPPPPPLLLPREPRAAPAPPLLRAQWVLGAPAPLVGFAPASAVELVPLLPPLLAPSVAPRAAKRWPGKRPPRCKIYLNNAFALDSAWIHPEESRIFQGNEKPLIMTNQVAMAIARPATASRPLPALVLAPQLLPGGCRSGPKAAGGAQAVAVAAAAAVLALESETPQGPSPRARPCRVLTLAPLRIPVLAAPAPGAASRTDAPGKPLVPAQVARLTALSAPAVTLVATSLMERALADNGKESSRASCPPALILHADGKREPLHAGDDQDHALKLLSEDNGAASGNKPVASAPVPGSPWCVVWTGDDRVFFFNPTMQLSVWEKPVDLKGRGDINRIIEDPPHKRKLETSATDRSIGSCPEDENDDLSIKTKRNKTEDAQLAGPPRGAAEEPRAAAVPPLEERATRFRDMLLERGVSAFSTWEKELHKIVFDPRYLLLNSEERKQIFEQFVKARIREEYKEKKNKLLLAKEEFKKLLEECKLSPRTTFKEFAEKYGRDQRFRLVQKKKDQEHFFNQFILILKKRDKENRIRLRKMR